eukprot:2903639-Pyramimonas_sp.AAC.1
MAASRDETRLPKVTSSGGALPSSETTLVCLAHRFEVESDAARILNFASNGVCSRCRMSWDTP